MALPAGVAPVVTVLLTILGGSAGLPVDAPAPEPVDAVLSFPAQATPAPLTATTMVVANDGYTNGPPTNRFNHRDYDKTHNAQASTSSRIASADGWQYLAYIDQDERSLVVARRSLAATEWTTYDTNVSFQPNAAHDRERTMGQFDYHHAPSVGIDPAGYVYIAFDHHADPLRYVRSAAPHDPRSWTNETAFDGLAEDEVTYVRFFRHDGDLHVMYRSGSSGAADLLLKRYEETDRTWRTVKGPLLQGNLPDGVDREGAYGTLEPNPYDGSLHMLWVWTDADGPGNGRALSYAWSPTGNGAWLDRSGSALPDPIRRSDSTAAIVRAGDNGNPQEAPSRWAFTPDGAAHFLLADEDSDPTKLEHLTVQDGVVSFRTLVAPSPGAASLVEHQGMLYAVLAPRGTHSLVVGRSAAPYDAWDWRPVGAPVTGMATVNVDIARWQEDQTLSLYVAERSPMPYLDAGTLQEKPRRWVEDTLAWLEGDASTRGDQDEETRLGLFTSPVIKVVDIPDVPAQFDAAPRPS